MRNLTWHEDVGWVDLKFVMGWDLNESKTAQPDAEFYAEMKMSERKDVGASMCVPTMRQPDNWMCIPTMSESMCKLQRLTPEKPQTRQKTSWAVGLDMTRHQTRIKQENCTQKSSLWDSFSSWKSSLRNSIFTWKSSLKDSISSWTIPGQITQENRGSKARFWDQNRASEARDAIKQISF